MKINNIIKAEDSFKIYLPEVYTDNIINFNYYKEKKDNVNNIQCFLTYLLNVNGFSSNMLIKNNKNYLEVYIEDLDKDKYYNIIENSLNNFICE